MVLIAWPEKLYFIIAESKISLSWLETESNKPDRNRNSQNCYQNDTL